MHRSTQLYKFLPIFAKVISMQREENLARVEKRAGPWDLIVIGGGATGVGCAVDAASRGLDVLLLEQSDFGKGTSSRSTKLVHGGVRYLAQGNLPLVREALKERGILLRNAPHIVRKTGFVVPCYSLWQKFFYGAGLKIYDLLSGKYRSRKDEDTFPGRDARAASEREPAGLTRRGPVFRRAVRRYPAADRSRKDRRRTRGGGFELRARDFFY